jgi:Sensors of blue-light using FAD
MELVQTMPDLRSILYVSTAVQPMAEEQLEALLVEARRLNLETEVTGMLLYSGGTFMQCFEGAEEAMNITYERIRKSRKHKGIIELLSEPIAQRTFPGWQMGFARASRSKLLALSTAQWKARVSEIGKTAGVSVSAGMQLLLDFWARRR